MKKVIVILLFVSVSISSGAQSVTPTVIATQGDYYSSAGGTISWTLGEIMAETAGDASNFLTQGFQQSSSFITSVHQLSGTSDISLYPNPIIEKVKVRVGAKAQLKVFNMLGEEAGSWNLSAGENEIDLKHLSNGIYIASIVSGNNTMVSYKINKSE